MTNCNVAQSVASSLGCGVAKGIRVLLIAAIALVMVILHQNDVLATKPFPRWPLNCKLAPESEEIVGVPVPYILSLSPAWRDSYGPIDKVEITMSLERGLKYSGPLKWDLDFKDQDEFTLPLEVVISKNDTAGFVLDLKVHFESGGIINQPFQRFFLSSDSPSYTSVGRKPLQLDPETWILTHGTSKQMDSLYIAKYARARAEAAENAKRNPPKAVEFPEGRISISEQGDHFIIERERAYSLRKAMKEEAIPLSGKAFDFYEIGKVFLGRLEGESKYRLFKPYSDTELVILASKNITPTYDDRFLDSVTIYLATGKARPQRVAEVISLDLIPTKVEAIFEVSVSIEQFKQIVQSRLRFETELSDFNSPQDSIQGSDYQD